MLGTKATAGRMIQACTTLSRRGSTQNTNIHIPNTYTLSRTSTCNKNRHKNEIWNNNLFLGSFLSVFILLLGIAGLKTLKVVTFNLVR